MQITSPGLSPSSSTRTGTSQTLSPACHISSNAWQHTRIHKGIISKSQVTSVCGEGGERTLHSASHSSCRCVDSGTKPILLYLVPIKSSIFLSDSFQTQWVESWALKLQPFYREGFARGSRQLDVPSQRHHWVWHGEDEHNRRQSKVKGRKWKCKSGIEHWRRQQMKMEKKEDRNERRHWVSVFRDIFVLTAVKTQNW